MTTKKLLALPYIMSLLIASISQADTSQTGQKLYQLNCAACHGVTGEGDLRWPQLNEVGDMTAPPHNEKGHTWRHSTEELIKMTSKGFRDPYNSTENLTMPAFETILSDSEIETIFDYIKDWWTPKQKDAQQALVK